MKCNCFLPSQSEYWKCEFESSHYLVFALLFRRYHVFQSHLYIVFTAYGSIRKIFLPNPHHDAKASEQSSVMTLFCVFIVDFEHIWRLFLVFLCWLWASKCCWDRLSSIVSYSEDHMPKNLFIQESWKEV